MTNFIERDQKRRNLVCKYEYKRLLYKSIINDSTIPKKIRYHYITVLNNLPKNSSKIRVKNRCIITGRGKSVYKFCKLSRISFRLLASQGLLAGVKKSSW